MATKPPKGFPNILLGYDFEKPNAQSANAKRVKLLKSRTVRIRGNQGRYSPGNWVETPDGKGFVDDRVAEGSVEGKDASSDSPVYVVGLLDGGVNFYRASELSKTDKPETEIEDPVGEVKEANNVSSNDITANDWTMPSSWRESETPARVILLDAWTSMGAQFDCGGGCCMGELKSRRLCAAMKDEALMSEKWRGGWAD